MRTNKQIAASHFSSDIIDFLKLLSHYEVQYMIVGGEAVIFYGHVRLTGDVDFFYGNTEENADKLYRALIDFWGGHIPDLEGSTELRRPGLILQFGIPPNRIDLMNEVSGVAFQDAWPRRIKATVSTPGEEETAVYFMGKDDIVANKKASARPKDLDDIPYLTGENH